MYKAKKARAFFKTRGFYQIYNRLVWKLQSLSPHMLILFALRSSYTGDNLQLCFLCRVTNNTEKRH